jgi:predicted glycosyltransferase
MYEEVLPANKKIIFAVLNWGLGHATRCIPIIERLLANDNQVVIASDGAAMQYLQNHFTTLKFITLPAYDVQYKFASIVGNVLYQLPKMWQAIKTEHSVIKNYVKENAIDLIISDSRLGVYAKDVASIFLTHQVQPYHPYKFIRWGGSKIGEIYLKRFSEVWIPDDEKIKLAGELSTPLFIKPKALYIGILSRMSLLQPIQKKHTTILLSGPEPQRSVLEEKLYSIFSKTDLPSIVFIRGSLSSRPNFMQVSSQMVIHDVVDSLLLNKILNETKCVVSRSGYSTLMDLHQLQLHAVLIPTPGQTEQEYLAAYHHHRWPVVYQHEIESKLLSSFSPQILH